VSQPCDILIVGSGAAGLAAAAATSPELDALVVEKCGVVGGTTALSGGTLWVPANSISRAQGAEDSLELGRRFLDETAAQGVLSPRDKDDDDTTYAARRDAFLETGPQLVDYLCAQGFRFSSKTSTYPDYQPDLPGALAGGGRTLDPDVFDAGVLGDWTDHMAPFLGFAKTMPTIVPRFQDFRVLTRPRASILDALTVAWMRLKTWVVRRLRQAPVSMGLSLIAQLLDVCRRRRNVRVWRGTALVRLVVSSAGAVTGAVVRRTGDDGVEAEVEIAARRGVLLAVAGFAQNQERRDRHLRIPTSTAWSLAQPGGDTGIALQLGEGLGAATAHLDKVWGIPTMRDPLTGALTFALFELTKPHAVVVSQRGARFFNEAVPYGSAVEAMYRQGEALSRAWLVVDQVYRSKYTIGSLGPGQDAGPAIDAGRLFAAATLPALAELIDVSPEKLEGTVDRWNTMCSEGKDLDFGRGDDAYQRYVGDPNVGAGGNRSMGPIRRGPFYAVEIFPGDAGTRGGLLTDEHARVLRRDGGAPIEGLYAAGNSTVSIVTGSSQGAGVTLAPAMTFGYIAARHMASRSRS
jgi:succinate dehydrogenase/fumarate reductase flavoprotein subunit